MIDQMNELVQHSKYEGKLSLQPVSGDISGRREAENNAEAGVGKARTMYAYVPVSGCPHPKQCQVVMVLRADDSEASAQETMERLGLDKLAEEKHFLLLFPNPTVGGWKPPMTGTISASSITVGSTAMACLCTSCSLQSGAPMRWTSAPPPMPGSS